MHEQQQRSNRELMLCSALFFYLSFLPLSLSFFFLASCEPFGTSEAAPCGLFYRSPSFEKLKYDARIGNPRLPIWIYPYRTILHTFWSTGRSILIEASNSVKEIQMQQLCRLLELEKCVFPSYPFQRSAEEKLIQRIMRNIFLLIIFNIESLFRAFQMRRSRNTLVTAKRKLFLRVSFSNLSLHCKKKNITKMKISSEIVCSKTD